MRATVFCLMVLCSVLAASPAVAGTIHVFAAASMTDALREIAALYGLRDPETEIRLHFAASGTLARQIHQGAPGDLYICAHPRWMDFLVDRSRVPPQGVQTLARNALVFIGAPGTAVSALEELPRLSRIALGSPSSVPAGEYAEAALKATGVHKGLEMGGKLVLAKDVRQALVYADRGEVDGAFVYRTDLLLAPRVKILFEPPADLYPPVIYPAALTMRGEQNPDAGRFFEFLFSAEAREILRSFDFLVDAAEAPDEGER